MKMPAQGLWHLIRQLTRQRADPIDHSPSEIWKPPSPLVPLAVIGDIHGRLDLLNAMLDKLDREEKAAQLVFVGDYVDRGTHGRQVLETLRKLPDAICLMGNHEAMLLEFLDTPIDRGGRWLRNGGSDTLSSYGISLNETSDSDSVLAGSRDLSQAMSDGTETWLRGLPLIWTSGNVAVAHAGADPAAPLDVQQAQDLLWGHRRFLRDSRSDQNWLVHGHWIRTKPVCQDGRINVDTGAFASGKLTAVILRAEHAPKFVQVKG